MPEEKPIILVVEDDIDVAEMLTAYFRVQGYEVLTANWGEDAVQISRSSHPNLVILDIRLPDIDGFEVARRLRTNRRTEEIPIIFLTEKRQRMDRLQGLEVGGDDYITKPFDIQELRLRVRNALRRTSQGTLTNPITGLAEGVLVDDRLSECLGSGGWAILTISLENLDHFREAYGFVASDDVQRAVSLMIMNSVRGIGGPYDFVGQLAQTEFVVITDPDCLPLLAERIHTRLVQALDFFYPLKDRDVELASDKRLCIRMAQLTAGESKAKNLDALKVELQRRQV